MSDGLTVFYGETPGRAATFGQRLMFGLRTILVLDVCWCEELFLLSLYYLLCTTDGAWLR